jgi:plastocyanin
MSRPRALAVAALALSLAVLSIAGCEGSNTSEFSQYGQTVSGLGVSGIDLRDSVGQTIAVRVSGFDPANATVKTGQVIRWVDRTNARVNVAFDQYSELDSPRLDPGAHWEVRFSRAGSYTYHTTIGPSFTGRVTVR